MRSAILAVAIAAVLGTGCGSRGSGGSEPPRTAGVASPDSHPARALVAADEPSRTRACTLPPPSASPSASERTRAIAALVAGELRNAVDAFDQAGRLDPQSLAAPVLRDASRSMLSEATARAARAVPEPLVAEPIPLGSVLRERVTLAPNGPPLQLTKISEAKNLVTDTDDWLARNGLSAPTARGRAIALPEYVASSVQGRPASALYHHSDHDVAVYGRVVGVFARGWAPVALDLSRAAPGLAITYARAVGEVLLVEFATNGYARDVGGKTGFIAAFGLYDGRLRWSSEALVANAASFAVGGAYIVTGYGFTAEPDAVFAIELATGKIAQRVPVRSAPELVLTKGDRIYVRSYDTDYVFAAAPAADPPPVSLRDDPRARNRTIDAGARCWIERAAAAIDARDAAALRDPIAALAPSRELEPVVLALQSARDRLGGARAPRVIDLTAARPIVVEAPPWDYALLMPPAAPPPAKAPALVQLSQRKADPVRMLDRNHGRPPFFIPPVESGRLPPGARPDIPTSYGGESLRAIIDSGGDRLVLIYGGRYIAIVEGSTTSQIFDLEAFRHPPRANPQWKEFAVEDATFALVDGGVLYVANGGGSYAREVFGKKGFVSAIDRTTGKLIWRSRPLVANATFGLAGEFLITGYGFTDEPDAVFVVRRADGKVVARAPVATAPDTITVSGRSIHVECYAHAYDFELRP